MSGMPELIPPLMQDMGRPLVREGARELMSGFNIWQPAPQAQDSLFQIVGSDFSQVLEIHLRPSEVVTAEPRSMLFASDGVSLGADMGGLGQGCKRCCCAGESMFRLHLQHDGRNPNSVEKVALTPAFPAKVVPVDLRQYDGLIFNRGAFLAALGRDWHVDVKMVRSLGTACCAGQGLFMNTLHGDGMVFLNAGGTVMTKQLAPGEKIVVDKHGLLAFERAVTISIRSSGGCMVCCCAAQGLFNTELTGPGLVWVHTMSLGKLRQAVGAAAGGGGGGNQGGGS